MSEDYTTKSFVKDMADILSGDVMIEQSRATLDKTRKLCKIITFIILLICAAIILCNYFIF